MYNICFFCCPSPLLKKNLIENCKILISHFRKFNFLGSIVRFMLCFCFFLCMCFYVSVCDAVCDCTGFLRFIFVVKFVVSECRSFPCRRDCP